MRVSELVFRLFEIFLQDSSWGFIGKGAGLSMNSVPFVVFVQSPLSKSRDSGVLYMFFSHLFKLFITAFYDQSERFYKYIVDIIIFVLGFVTKNYKKCRFRNAVWIFIPCFVIKLLYFSKICVLCIFCYKST